VKYVLRVCNKDERGRVAKSCSERGGPKAPSAIHGPLGPMFYPNDKANIIADSLENEFRAHYLCDCGQRRHVETQVKALLATIDEDILLISNLVTPEKKYNP
jgi:hypothetical protein